MRVLQLVGLALVLCGCEDVTPSGFPPGALWNEPMLRSCAILSVLMMGFGAWIGYEQGDAEMVIAVPLGALTVTAMLAVGFIVVMALSTYGFRGEALYIRFPFAFLCISGVLVVLALGFLASQIPGTDFRKAGSVLAFVAILMLNGVGLFFTARDVWEFVGSDDSTETASSKTGSEEPQRLPGPQFLCGHESARPQTIEVDEWARYHCVSQKDAADWDSCLRRHVYTREAGRGCSGDSRCCPAP